MPEAPPLELPPQAELDFVDHLTNDLIGQLAPQLQAMGKPTPVLLYALAAAAAVVQTSAELELEQLKLEKPDEAQGYAQQWRLVLERRKQFEQRAEGETRKAHAEKGQQK